MSSKSKFDLLCGSPAPSRFKADDRWRAICAIAMPHAIAAIGDSQRYAQCTPIAPDSHATIWEKLKSAKWAKYGPVCRAQRDWALTGDNRRIF